jgi:protein-disulfide isomerase
VLVKYPDNVKLVIKHFPIRNHKFAYKAATAALAANVQGKFWEFHSKLAKNYRTINDAKIKDMNNGRQAGVRGTPTIFINGKKLRNKSLPGIYQMIEAELKKAG